MKNFEPVTFDYGECCVEVEELKTLLAAKEALSEKHDVIPFFQSKRQLAMLFGMFNSRIGSADRFAKEFNIFGDFSCDMAVGDWARGAYCFVEFEDAREGSIFEKKGDKATREWGRRFEHGYSQIIDWLHKLAGREVSVENLARFGMHEITYEAVLVIGRNRYQDAAEAQRQGFREPEKSALHDIRRAAEPVRDAHELDGSSREECEGEGTRTPRIGSAAAHGCRIGPWRQLGVSMTGDAAAELIHRHVARCPNHRARESWTVERWNQPGKWMLLASNPAGQKWVVKFCINYGNLAPET